MKWELWKMRNDKVFNRHDPSPPPGLPNLRINVTFSRLGLKMTCGYPFVFGSMLSVKLYM
jgi:hypothetical protein